MSDKAFPDYRLFGRRQDRPLKLRQQQLMETLLPRVAVTEAIIEDAAAVSRPVWLEIGFGGGEHLAWHAARNPDVLMIGAEPFINGVAKLLTQIDEQGLQNVRILHGDARDLLQKLPTGLLSRLFILHPDPWPKKKHYKRRIVSPLVLAEAARLLRPGSEMRIASDIPDYIRWSLMQVQAHNRKSQDFLWTALKKEDWTHPPSDWPQTRYEAKAIREGRLPTYLSFCRMPCSERQENS
ncbi:tRNA (guanosine(46)-N7)-methyltransferase TrmB [Parvularcula sp. IMCC14364]|uniref:tRNA (guanosine(46)-N7)-methyltransferase TrmB n=1 Tax=Parvularcula sp. IMCC14364 TaxID=3067902 RepID=UPI0027406DF1|nr:tRNA (guanosine(46)-N7)-methyltransferase TrmB [Parvularcula sp. IMCC14364]